MSPKPIKKQILCLVTFVAAAMHASTVRAADEVDFPDEELAAESVLPIFDDPATVKNRTVTTAGRFEFGPLFGQSMLEPFFNPFYFGAAATYHIDEENAFNLIGTMFMSGTSANADQLNPIPKTSINANLQYAPAPKYLFLGNWQYTGFYGKISLTKEFIMNLSVYGFGGLGMIGIGDALKPAMDLGIGQKFYFGDRFALRVDLRFLIFQGPDILSRKLDQATGPQAASSFSDKMNTATLFSVGGVYLLPEL